MYNDSWYSKKSLRFICKKCNSCYLSEDRLKKHLEKHEKWTKQLVPGKLECKLCTYNCSSNKWVNFYDHYTKQHILGRHIACDECDKRFTNQSNLKAHKLSKHSTEKPFKCDKCSYRTKKKYHLDTEWFRIF